MNTFDALSEQFSATFGHRCEAAFSAPGRIEIGGNHTDHQRGRVLAAAIDLDTKAVAARRSDGLVTVRSEGYAPFTVDLNSPYDMEANRYTSLSIVRGMAEAFRREGIAVGGFEAAVCSDVGSGSGLSSSAAFEVLIGAIFNLFYARSAFSPTRLAQFGQWAENEYFGKPSGLMDQLASALGGINAIDFADNANPAVQHMDFDFEKAGYAVYVVDCGADHAELTGHYAAITEEMGSVAAFFGEKQLRSVDYDRFLQEIPVLREKCGDRAVLRALHFFGDNARVPRQAAALEQGRVEDFLSEVTASGRSSYTMLQNVIAAGWEREQSLAVTVSLIETLLEGRGAVRVHGGGFAGTALAFVPLEFEETFCKKITSLLNNKSCCHRMAVRREGVTARYL